MLGEWDEPPFSRGAAGCALSHALAYKRIIDLNLPYGIVMEDDITKFYTDNIPGMLKYIGSPTAHVGKGDERVRGWDVVQLQTCPYGQARGVYDRAHVNTKGVRAAGSIDSSFQPLGLFESSSEPHAVHRSPCPQCTVPHSRRCTWCAAGRRRRRSRCARACT